VKVQKVISAQTNERTILRRPLNLKLLRFFVIMQEDQDFGYGWNFQAAVKIQLFAVDHRRDTFTKFIFNEYNTFVIFSRDTLRDTLRPTYHIIRHSTSAYANRNPTFLNQIQPPEPPPTGKTILCLPCARPLLTPLQPRTHVMYSGTRMSYKPPPWGPHATVYLLTAFRPLPVVLLPECIRVEERGSCLP